jgi:predicted phosphodiesterase
MRIAVFSDVHGNPYACETTLKSIRSEASCDAVVAAGDLCLGGSDPSACVDMLRDAGVRCVYGNTEVYINHPDQPPEDENHRSKWDKLQPAVYWTRSKLSADQLDWMSSLPFECNFSPTQNPVDDLLVVHANPKDVELMIYPGVSEQQRLWKKVRQPDDDPDLITILSDTVPNTIAFGHFHYPSTRRWRDKLLVNVASCSLPGVDYDRRVRYSLFDWKNGEWTVKQRWVEYETDQEINALYAREMPSKEFFIRYFG